jgi:hypothetical protein
VPAHSFGVIRCADREGRCVRPLRLYERVVVAKLLANVASVIYASVHVRLETPRYRSSIFASRTRSHLYQHADGRRRRAVRLAYPRAGSDDRQTGCVTDMICVARPSGPWKSYVLLLLLQA